MMFAKKFVVGERGLIAIVAWPTDNFADELDKKLQFVQRMKFTTRLEYFMK